MHWIDIAIVVLYTGGIFLFGISFYVVDKIKACWRTARQPLKEEEEGENDETSSIIMDTEASGAPQEEEGEEEEASTSASTTNYFLAARSTPFWAIACSLFSSNISSEHFLGLSASGKAVGISIALNEWTSPLFMLLLGWIFSHFYLSSSVYTMPEYLEKRYNKFCRMYLTFFSIFMYIITKISVALYAGNVVFTLLVNWNPYVSSIVIIGITGIYVIFGGLAAVVYSEVIQTVIILVGGLVLFGKCWFAVDGWQGLLSKLPDHYVHLWQPASDSTMPWTGVLFGMPFISMYYWTCDQVIVQRVLSAKSLNHARAGCTTAGYLKFLPPLIMVFPGMAAILLLPKTTPPNEVYVQLITKLLPIGLQGLLIAAMLSALMSSLASVIHSSATLITMDLVRELPQLLACCQKRFSIGRRLQIDARHFVTIGRVAALLCTLCGLLAVPLVSLLSEQMYIYTHKVMSYMSPPVAVVFFLGTLSSIPNAYGATATLVLGGIIGLSRFILELIYHNQKLPFGVASLFIQSNFLHFAAVFGFFCIALHLIVSLLSASCISPSARTSANLLSIPYHRIFKTRRAPPTQPPSLSIQDVDTLLEVSKAPPSTLWSKSFLFINLFFSLSLFASCIILFILLR